MSIFFVLVVEAGKLLTIFTHLPDNIQKQLIKVGLWAQILCLNLIQSDKNVSKMRRLFEKEFLIVTNHH